MEFEPTTYGQVNNLDWVVMGDQMLQVLGSFRSGTSKCLIMKFENGNTFKAIQPLDTPIQRVVDKS